MPISDELGAVAWRDADEALAEQLDAALQRMWDGDASGVERLVGGDGTGDGEPGRVIGALARLAPPGGAEERPPEIAGYSIVKEIGRGGMGIVYEAVQAEPARVVAIKVSSGEWRPGLGGGRRRTTGSPARPTRWPGWPIR